MAFVPGEGGAKVITPSPMPVSAEAPGGTTTRPGSLTASWEEGSSLLSTQPHPLTAEAEPIPKYICLSCPKALTCSLMSQSSQSFLTGCRSVHLTSQVRLQGPSLTSHAPSARPVVSATWTCLEPISSPSARPPPSRLCWTTAPHSPPCSSLAPLVCPLP